MDALQKKNSEFKSVLFRPFQEWMAIEEAVAERIPQLTCVERSKIIENVIRFLELKVIMEEYTRDQNLVVPTELVAYVWSALSKEKSVYRRTVTSIQDFHGRSRRKIHYCYAGPQDDLEYAKKLERTQSLFLCYHGESMPVFLYEIEGGLLDSTDQSSLLDHSVIAKNMLADELSYRSEMIFRWFETILGRVDATVTCCKIDDDAFTVATHSITDTDTVKMRKSSLDSGMCDESAGVVLSKPNQKNSVFSIFSDFLLSKIPDEMFRSIIKSR